MPASQGVQRWPESGRVVSVLFDEDRLPFKEAVFDRALAVHLVEESEALQPLLRELWRVTAPEARIVVIAANRMGLWARAESSPFGQGRSFSRRQLSALLRDAMFEPVHWARALHAPPLSWGPLLSASPTWEGVSDRVLPAFGGVVLVEAIKRVAAETPRTGRRLVFAPATVTGGTPAWRREATGDA
jgi:SAM-dependent methyltransferase